MEIFNFICSPIKSLGSIPGLIWGEIGERSSMKEDLMASGNEDYIELANRMKVEKDIEERYANMETGNYAKFVKVGWQMHLQITIH